MAQRCSSDGLRFSHIEEVAGSSKRGRDAIHKPLIFGIEVMTVEAAQSPGETIFVNPQGISQIRRIVVLHFYLRWSCQMGRHQCCSKSSVPGCEDIIVKMGQQSSIKLRYCFTKKLVQTNSMTVQKLVTFHDGHSDCCPEYGWGFNYSPGSK